MKSKALRPSTPMEVTSDTLSHALGLVLSIAGLILLFSWSDAPMSLTAKLSLGVFGLSLIALYLASTLYHASRDVARKRFYKYCDHSAIYLLIAGTYTPYCLLNAGHVDSEWLVLTVWVMAAIGIVAKFYLVGRYRFVSTVMYILMGWMAVLHYDLLLAMPRGQLQWLLAGGISYTFGAIFYLWHQLPFNHAIWHLFVLGGSVSHFMGVLLYSVGG